MINIGFIGSVSVGKTTIINSLIGDFLGNTNLKRTTYKPFQFIKTEKEYSSCLYSHEIMKEIDDINSKTSNSSALNEYPFYNDRWGTKINSVYNGLSIIDFPGLFDAKESSNKMEDLFLSHLNNLNFVFYILDSNQCLNNKYEKDFINKLITNIKNSDYYIELNIIFNKYDEDDDEVLELINEAILTIKEEFDYSPKFFILSGRKLMVKEIIIKNRKFDTIPINIVTKVFNIYFGKSKSKKIINANYISLDDFTEIEYSKHEKSFFKYLSKIMNTHKYYDKCLVKTNELLKLIIQYDICKCNCLCELKCICGICSKLNIQQLLIFKQPKTKINHIMYQDYLNEFIKIINKNKLLKDYSLLEKVILNNITDITDISLKGDYDLFSHILNNKYLTNKTYYLNIIFEWLITNICSGVNSCYYKIISTNKIKLFSLFNEYKELIIKNESLLDMYEVILFHHMPYWSVLFNKKDFLLYRLIVNSINETPYELPSFKNDIKINLHLRGLIEDFYSGMDNEFLNDFEIQEDKLLEYPISIVTYCNSIKLLKRIEYLENI